VIAPVMSGYWPYHLADARMPRCTLATGVPNAAALIGALGEGTLPTAAAVETVGLIEGPSGRLVFQIGGGQMPPALTGCRR
jgi:hypothetical protein